MGKNLSRLYAILDPTHIPNHSIEEACDILLRSGVQLLQYRDKRASSRQAFEMTVFVRQRAMRAGAVFIVNDRTDVALASGADGVHLGQEDLPVEGARQILGPGKWIGLSTHTLDQLCAGEAIGPDYLAFGPIFPTASKENSDPIVGIEGLRRARRETTRPLVAIGGITLENAAEVLAAGADSVAVISDFWKHTDPESRIRKFVDVVGGSVRA